MQTKRLQEKLWSAANWDTTANIFMQSKFVLLTVCLALLSTIALSCKKEKEEATAFNAVGYSRGNAYNLLQTAVLNKPDGSARIYFRIMGTDSAKAVIGNGRYTIANNTYNAFGITNTNDTLFLDLYNLSGNTMSGALYTTFSAELVECNLRRQ